MAKEKNTPVKEEKKEQEKVTEAPATPVKKTEEEIVSKEVVDKPSDIQSKEVVVKNVDVKPIPKKEEEVKAPVKEEVKAPVKKAAPKTVPAKIDNVSISVDIWKNSVNVFHGYRSLSDIVKILENSQTKVIVETAKIASQIIKLVPAAKGRVSSKK